MMVLQVGVPQGVVRREPLVGVELQQLIQEVALHLLNGRGLVGSVPLSVLTIFRCAEYPKRGWDFLTQTAPLELEGHSYQFRSSRWFNIGKQADLPSLASRSLQKRPFPGWVLLHPGKKAPITRPKALARMVQDLLCFARFASTVSLQHARVGPVSSFSQCIGKWGLKFATRF